MRRVNKTAISLLLLMTAMTAPGQTNPEDEPFCDARSGTRVEITDADATILGLTIGRASLKDVHAKLGSANVTRVSRDEESDVSVCYVSPLDGTVLVFYSGAMGGWEDITWFALWSGEATFPRASQCTISKAVSRSLHTQSGIRLGVTKADLEQIAGKATELAARSLKYSFLCRRKMTDDEVKRFKAVNNWDVRNNPYFDRTSWIEVRYSDSTATRVEVGRFDSY
jgi:hypothetical protein